MPIHEDAAGDLERALHEGEDFELLVAHPPLEAAQVSVLREAGVILHAIGRTDAESGIRLRDAAGTRPLPARGFDHLAE